MNAEGGTAGEISENRKRHTATLSAKRKTQNAERACSASGNCK